MIRIIMNSRNGDSYSKPGKKPKKLTFIFTVHIFPVIICGKKQKSI